MFAAGRIAGRSGQSRHAAARTWSEASTRTCRSPTSARMEELYRMRSVDVLDVITTIIGAMGMMGLALAIVGLYGLVAYAASRRTERSGSAWRSAPAGPMSCGWCCGKAWASRSPGSALVCWRAPARPRTGSRLSRRPERRRPDRSRGVPAGRGNRAGGDAAGRVSPGAPRVPDQSHGSAAAGVAANFEGQSAEGSRRAVSLQPSARALALRSVLCPLCPFALSPLPFAL